MNNGIDAVRNRVWSLIWPVEWMRWFGVNLFSAALLTACYGVYRLIRPWVLRMLENPVEGVHPNEAGYRVMARLWSPPSSRRCAAAERLPPQSEGS